VPLFAWRRRCVPAPTLRCITGRPSTAGRAGCIRFSTTWLRRYHRGRIEKDPAATFLALFSLCSLGCERGRTATCTSQDVDDGSQVGALLEQVTCPVASFIADGAYDRDDVYREVTERHPDAVVIVPPRLPAVPSATAETTPRQRDRHLQLIAERGRMGWQKFSGYNWRALGRPTLAASSA
jgi:hypothetical protein